MPDTPGDVASFRLAANRVILLRHPHHIRRVLQQKSGVYDRSSMPYRMSRSLFGRGLTALRYSTARGSGTGWTSGRTSFFESFGKVAKGKSQGN